MKTDPAAGPLAFPTPATAKLEPADLRDKLLASTLVVGLYYHCADCHQMHFQGAGGFVVAEDGFVSTCAHVLDFDPKKMLQAYPAVIDSRGTVYPVDELVALDPVADTVILHASGGKFPPLSMRPAARAGEPVYCLSHPGNNLFIFTSGLISRVETVFAQGRPLRMLDVSCEYSPGSSGGPITDACGNVVAQVNKISSQLFAGSGQNAAGPQATVFNLRPATGAVEIARLADPASRTAFTAEPAKAADDTRTAATPPESGPATANDLFMVHCKYELLAAPANLALDREARNFAELYQRMHESKGAIICWGRDDQPKESTVPNDDPVGFTGVTGYYDLPGSTEPRSHDNTLTRGIDFKMTFRDRKEEKVGLRVDVNDNRATPAAADQVLNIEATLTKNAFTLVKLGPPQADQQAWLAIVVDDFAAQAAMMPVQDGKLPADKKVDFKFTAADGQEIDTTKMRGKVILVDFWATWCGPCVDALPLLEKLHARFHGQGLEIIGINLDSERSAMDKFLQRHPHPWPQSITAPSGQNPLADRFEFQGIPFFLLIDKAGVAAIIDARNPDTENRIAALLQAEP